MADEYTRHMMRTLGFLQASQSMGRDDYPIDLTDQEREAWWAGWDEYQRDLREADDERNY